MGKIRNEQECYNRNKGFRYKAYFDATGRVEYEMWTDPHRKTSESSWQIVKHTYNASKRLTDSNWARGGDSGVATDDFVHIADDYLSLTYGPE